MRKKLLSLALALVMCLGLAVPAMAAEVQHEDFIFEFSNAPTVATLTYKTWDSEKMEEVDAECTVYVVPDNTTVFCKTVPEGRVCYDMIDTNMDLADVGWTEPGEPLVIVPSEYIYSLHPQNLEHGDTDSYPPTLGERGLYVMAASSAAAAGLITQAPAQPSTPAVPATPAAPVTAVPTSSPVLVNGVQIAFDAYEINDNNYFKLRDLAYVLNGTGKQFEISWNETENAIALTSGQPYTAVGGEMTSKGEGSKSAVPTTSKIFLDGTEISLTAYNIGDNNYFKLRDIGAAFDFGVDWDAAAGIIRIDTSKGYTPD